MAKRIKTLKVEKAYLSSLIHRIDASPTEITITGKNSTLAGHAIVFANSDEKVLSFDQEWLPEQDSNL